MESECEAYVSGHVMLDMSVQKISSSKSYKSALRVNSHIFKGILLEDVGILELIEALG